jgi:hypothetical protein
VGPFFIDPTKWTADSLLYLRDRTLMAQPFDPGRLETTGEAVPVAEQVDNNQGWTRWGVSSNGVLAYTSGAIGLEQLTWPLLKLTPACNVRKPATKRRTVCSALKILLD